MAEVTVQGVNAGKASWPTLQTQRDLLEVAAAALRAAGIPTSVTNDVELWMYPRTAVAYRRHKPGDDKLLGVEKFAVPEDRNSLVVVTGRQR